MKVLLTPMMICNIKQKKKTFSLIQTISGQNINSMATVDPVDEEADNDGSNVKLNAVRYKNGMYNNSASSGW